MRAIIEGCISLLVCALLMAALPTDAEAEIYEDTVRLHILAYSDSEEDQRLKLQIRDLVLQKYGTELAKAQSSEQAEAMARELLAKIESDVCVWIKDAGYSYEATVTLGKEWYERRNYGEYTLPEGEYSSLRIIIGEGEGKNWWCVMYPPMCLDIATAPAEDRFSDGQQRIIKAGKYNVKLKMLEILSEAFRKTP